ncbi:uncharacterized protein N0V89_006858 [Didymosphaeria variabile]|uniref:Uncharacterized protein n=1 Tax=Didymosphaeria variabile TaxID=1932322 RepID=A0A9W8XKD0_9PLEO|nr:uncharacterized protein N0V89_006858 [Didymosphaeria variabile]KAJ4351515.1 hypothetical protein N0V89_006858 [Didymosphaeria variabile]
MPGSSHPAGNTVPLSAPLGRLSIASATNKGKVDSKVLGPTNPAGQALRHAASTNKPKSSTSVSRSASPGGKPTVTTRQPVQKAERSMVGPGQENRLRVPRFTSSSRATAPTAPRKPRHLLNESETWKAKYEEQLKETQKAQSETKKAKSELGKHVAEHAEKLAASEACRKQADREAGNVTERLVKVQAELELNRQVNDELSTQVENCDRIEELEAQAKLAGELQTELNGLRNVRLPSLEQENKAIKQELRQMLEDVEMSSDAPACAPIRVQGEQGVVCQHEPHNSTQAFQNFLRESEAYINQLEEASTWLESKYTEATFEKEDLENLVTALQATNAHLKEQSHDLIFGHNQPTRDHDDLQAEKPVLRVMNIAPRTDSSCSSSSVASKYSGIVSAVQTVPSFSPTPPSTFSGILAGIETEALPQSKLGMTDISTVVIRPIDFAATHKPRPPLDQDLQITINIDSTARAKLTLLQRLTAVTTRDTTFKINGPAEIAKALANGMVDTQARAKHNEAKVLELQQMMWSYIREMEQMKKAACNMVEHKNLADQFAAMEARLQMQDMLLADNGRQLARHKQGRTID